MLIRNLIIIGVIGGFLLGLHIYFRQNISPYNLEDLNNLILEYEIEEDDFESLSYALEQERMSGNITLYLSEQYYVGFGLLVLSVSTFFIVLHLFFEKLFFKKFFESPSYFDAFRRGAFLGLGIYLLQVLGLYQVDTVTILAILGVLLLLEFGYVNFVKGRV